MLRLRSSYHLLRMLILTLFLVVVLFATTSLQPANAQYGTSLTLSDINILTVNCAHQLDLTVDMRVEVPESGKMAEFEWIIEAPTGSTTFVVPVISAGPGPDSTFHNNHGFYRTANDPLPANSLISFIFRDLHSSAEAGISVNCSTGAIVDVWSSPAGGPAPGPDMVPIPDQAVGGSIVQTTPLYFEPRESARTNTVIEAGKTLWVYGMDESGAYYKGMLAGKIFWLPVDAVGPNYDEVWNGTPLPTTVVE